jgi:hypothetical protein
MNNLEQCLMHRHSSIPHNMYPKIG